MMNRRTQIENFLILQQRQYRNIQLQCPVWCHVRKSNPRQSQGAARSLIYRRGYLYIEGGRTGMFSSGLSIHLLPEEY